MGAVGLGALSQGAGSSVSPSSSAASGDISAGVNAPTTLQVGGSGKQSQSTGAGDQTPILIAVGLVGVVAIVLAFRK